MITGLFGAILAFMYFKISWDVIVQRHKHQISLGPGENNEILPVVSAHDNFNAYIPLLLILMFLAEYTDLFANPFLYAVGGAFTLGRGLHFVAFSSEKMNFKLRKLGMHLTFWPLLTLAGMILYSYIKLFIL